MEGFPYPFKTSPFKHQLVCWLRQKDETAFPIFSEQGTGKTKMAIDTAAWLYDQDRIDTLVVLAPKGVYLNWADKELPEHMPDHIRYRVGIWSSEGKKAAEESLARLNRRDGNYDLQVLLVNIEALGRDLQHNRCFTFLSDFLLSRKAMVVIDESTTIKNPQATRTKALFKLAKLTSYRRILTGNPSPNGPLDLWAQGEFLEPGYWGFGSYYSFRAHFAKLIPMRIGNRKIQRVAGYQNLDELQKLLAAKAYVVKKDDCLDLPPKVYMPPRYVEMGKQQAKAYDDMRKLAIVEIEKVLSGQDFELQPPVEGEQKKLSTAQIVITQMLRLHQILCGFMVTDDKQVVPFEETNPRMEALMESLDEVSGKAIVWATYKYNVRQIYARIAEQYGPDSVVSYFGETPVDDRRVAVKRFQDPGDPCRFFVSNRTGARGLTLTQAGDVFYYSNDYDADTRSQNEDRAHRIGQDKSVTYTDFIVKGTQDEKVVKALRDKRDISSLITASNWREFLK